MVVVYITVYEYFRVMIMILVIILLAQTGKLDFYMIHAHFLSIHQA